MNETKDDIVDEPIQYTVKQKAREEGRKLQYDFFKHLTTLSTGSILLSVTFLEKLFTQPHWKILIAFSFGLFGLSILSSIITMIMLSALVLHFGETYQHTKGINRILRFSFTCAGAGFISGILCFIVFALKNLYG